MSARIESIIGNVKIQKLGQLPRQARIGDVLEDDEFLILRKDSTVEYTCSSGVIDQKTVRGIYGLNILCPIPPSPLSITARRTELLARLIDTQQELAAIKVIEDKPEAAKQLLENALSNSEELGNSDLISSLQKKIMEL